MEKQTGFMGIPSPAWGVIGILALAVGAILIVAMVLLAFGVDVGLDIA